MTAATDFGREGMSLPFGRELTGSLDSVVFTGAVTGHDPTTGRLVTSLGETDADPATVRYGSMFLDIPADAVLGQAWQAYANLGRALEAAGASLGGLCRQRVYVRDLRDVPFIERVMDEFLDAGTVATTIVLIGAAGVNPDVLVQVEGVALRPEAGSKQAFRDPDLHGLSDRYPAVVKAAQFAFVSSTPGINPETGRVARGMDELGDDAERFRAMPYATAQQRAILAQSWFVFRHVRAALALAGGRLSDIVKVNGWLDFPMRDFDPLRPVRLHYFPELEDKVASTSLWVGPNPTDGSLLAYDATAVVDDARGRDKQVLTEPSLIVPYYVGAAGGGGAVFTCGEVPIEEATPRAITQPHELEGSTRRLAFGRLEALSGIEARASYVYEKLDGYLRQYGSSLDRVVHQVIYLQDMREHSALELVSRSVFGGRVPPTTTVPIFETSPFYREARLEIEVVASAG